MTTYHCTMDDETRIDVKASSAADAMQLALERHIGHRVKQCWSGNQTAYIDFEVPKHEPLLVAPEKKERKKRKKKSEIEDLDFV